MASFGGFGGGGGQQRRVQKSREVLGYSRTHPYSSGGGGGSRSVSVSLQSRLGYGKERGIGRGRGRGTAQLSRRDLRLTKLGLTTKKTTGAAKGLGNFDLRQKLSVEEENVRSKGRNVRSTFSKAIEETYGRSVVGSKEEIRLITEPLSPPPKPKRSNIKVTIEGLGKSTTRRAVGADSTLHVDKRQAPLFLSSSSSSTSRNQPPILANYKAMGARGSTGRRRQLRDFEEEEEEERSRSPFPTLIYEDIEQPVVPVSPPPPPPSSSSSRGRREMTEQSYIGLKSGTKLIVSNLQPSVTYEDVVELFSDIGELRSASFISNGIAEVVYCSSEDANAAFRKYHQRNLDGQPMMIRVGLAGNQPSSSSSFSRTSSLSLRKEMVPSSSSYSVQYKMT
ncbi:uncharacterized protein [Oscarella lobularis]|uniref:uncharacterized protein isoform X2 n=1 Tax=Oscarella lobularis TaxID=121494 RepID=UPI003313EC89